MKFHTVRSGFKRGEAGSPRAGFTMIELLVVIAIIAILAATVFPVARTVRIRAQQAQVTSNLKAIQASVGMYKLDENGYPPGLGQVVLQGSGCPDASVQNLYPEWLRDRGAYHSPNNELEDPSTLFKVDLPASINKGYIASLPGGNERPEDVIFSPCAHIYGWDNMSGHVEGGRYLLHYSRYRTANANDCDYKRQLGQRNPPETTVVTWNDSFVVRNADTGAPIGGDYIVLFLNGTVRKYSLDQVQRQLRAKRDSGCPDVDPDKEQVWRVEPF